MKNKINGGITPNPILNLQTALKWRGVKIHNKTNGTNEETTNPKSIIALVNQLKYLFLWPEGNWLANSEAITEEVGYSAPIAIPKKNLHTVRQAKNPWTVVPQEATAHINVKKINITLAVNIPVFLSKLSEI